MPAPHPELPHHILPLSDGRLHYMQAGTGTGAPILLIHGSLCDYRYWRPQMPAFADTHQVLAPSLRGCWPNTQPHPQRHYSVSGHAADLAHLLQALDARGGAHIVGHSRGAQVAADLAIRAPQLCRSLTLADPGFRFTDEPETPVFYADAVERLRQGDPEGAIEQFIDTEVKYYSSGMFLRLAFSVAVHTDPDVFLVDEILSVGDEPFQRKCLERIRQLQDDGRTMVIVSHELEMLEQLCTRIVVLRGGRIIHDGDPAEAVRVLRAG